MMEGLIRLFEWIGQQWREFISPFVILRCYEGGVLLRLGKYKHNLKLGLNWKIPFIDEIHTAIVTVDTFNVLPIAVTTKDGKQVSVEPIVKFDIPDVKKYLLEANDAASNLRDVSRGTIADYLTDVSWEELSDKKTFTAIKNALKKECDDLGVNIHKVYFGRIVNTKMYTIFRE